MLFFSKVGFTKTTLVFLVSLFIHLSLSVSSVAEEELTAFVRTLLLETSANKRADIETLEIKSCSSSCVSFKSSLGAEFKLVIDTDRSEPELSFTRDSRTLTLPSLSYVEEELIGSSRESRSFRESGNPPSIVAEQESGKLESSPEELSRLIHRWLVGHELHPYSGGFSLIKPSQAIALAASREVLMGHQKEQSSLLNIAPTASGKTLVLVQTLMEQIETYSNGKKIFIVTADRIHLIEQLHSQIQSENKQRAIDVINWGTLRDKSWQSFASEVKRANEREGATVMVITSQSLKLKLPEFFTETEQRYRAIQESFVRNVGGIYIDEAHHLGASETRKVVLDLVERSKAFLYGATATPVHHEVELRDFFKQEHWTYLNTKDNLFERHSTDSILEQLAMGIERGELTPFDDLYVIGEQTFKDLEKGKNTNRNNDQKESSVFIQAESAYYVLNPAHYENLLRIIEPILSANKKGFIVTATIAEAERLTEFLNQSVSGIEFEVLHSEMEEEERRAVLRRSVNSKDSHYIVSVRVLDEGINLPHLSAYIDLNFNVSIKQMIHRIGRVLRLYPNKLSSDVLFLIDYRDESKARDALSILDKMKSISFRGGETRRGVSGDSHLLYAGTDISPMSRRELEGMRERLSDSIRKFWQERYTLEELPKAVARLNKSLPENEKIRSNRTYKEYLERKDRDKRLPPLRTARNWYKNKHGSTQGFMDFILGRIKVEYYSLEEIPGVVARLNKSLPENKQIKDGPTYNEYLERKDRDKRLPPFGTAQHWYKNKHGSTQGLMDFILSESNLLKYYSLEEIPGVVARLNKSLPENEQIKDGPTYNEYLERKDRDKRLPPLGTARNWYEKEHGQRRGFMDFILGRIKVEYYSLEEIPGVVARLNKGLPENEKIKSERTYNEYLRKEDRDKRLPPLRTARNWYKNKHGHRRGLIDFILSESNLLKYYSLEEIPGVVARLNKGLPENEKIKSERTYNEYLRKEDRDKRLPSLGTARNWYEKEHGHRRGLIDFILSESNLLKYYSLEEIPGVVARLNKGLPENEKIKSERTYNEYLRKEDRDKRLPSLGTARNWYEKEHGHRRGLIDFILSESNLKKSGSCPTSFSSSP